MTTPTGPIDSWAEDFMRGRLSRRDFIKRLAAAGLTFSSIGAILAACAPAAPGGSPAGTPRTSALKKLGFNHPFPGTDIYRPLRKGLREEAAKLGVETLESSANGKADVQLAELNTWIESLGVQAISILNINGEGLKPVVDRAHEKGIKVIGYAFHLDGEDGYNVFDNKQGAELVADAAVKWIEQNIP